MKSPISMRRLCLACYTLFEYSRANAGRLCSLTFKDPVLLTYVALPWTCTGEASLRWPSAAGVHRLPKSVSRKQTIIARASQYILACIAFQ